MIAAAICHVAVTVHVGHRLCQQQKKTEQRVSECEQRDCGGNITWGRRQSTLCVTPPS